MNFNYKLYFKYILFFTNQIFLKYLIKNDKNINLFIYQKNLYYLTLHLKLSSLFYSTQLIEIFAYEIPTNNNEKIKNKNISNVNNSIIVYNFHNIIFQQRFFLFILNKKNYNLNKNFTT